MHDTQATPGSLASRSAGPWTLLAIMAVLLAVSFALRLGTRILSIDLTFDETYIIKPIDDILTEGWSMRTAVDFEETKGPTLIWSYALLGELFGTSLNQLRLISVLMFCASLWPFLRIARRCGLHGAGLWAAAGMYALLPYNLVLAQLLMSEPLFMLNTLLLLLSFMWGFGGSRDTERRVLGPVLFGVLLSLALHNRVHAVAFAGAACLIAAERDGRRSWPWWLACVVAGISRIPLWLRWGGLVSPMHQSMHSLGFSLDSLTYLGAALVPWTGLLLWQALADPAARRRTWMIAVGALVGFAIALVAPVNFTHALPFQDTSILRYLGMLGSAVRWIGDTETQRLVMIGLTTFGMASLGALATLSWRDPVADPRGVANRLVFWSLCCGWGLYALTSAFVFDRYLLPWAALLPIVWVLHLPRWLLCMQALLFIAIDGWLIRQWLMTATEGVLA
jgi:hypothetical protein